MLGRAAVETNHVKAEGKGQLGRLSQGRQCTGARALAGCRASTKRRGVPSTYFRTAEVSSACEQG
jgi:hypothetical protein